MDTSKYISFKDGELMISYQSDFERPLMIKAYPKDTLGKHGS